MRLGAFHFRPGLWPTLAAVAVLPVLLWLGIWQLGRAGEKLAFERLDADRSDDSPLRVGAGAALGFESGDLTIESWHFRPVLALGRYSSARQFLLDNRTLDGVAGYHVVTPLRLEGTELSVLVDRGWVPVGASREILPDLTVDEATREVAGVAAPAPRVPVLLGESGYERAGWPRVVQRIEYDPIRTLVGGPVLPFLVRLDPAAPDGFTRRWTAFAGIGPDRHRAYAVQWFGLAATLVVIYIAVNLRRVESD